MERTQQRSSLSNKLKQQIEEKQVSKYPSALYLTKTLATDSFKTSDKSVSYKRSNLSIQINEFIPEITDDQIIETSNHFHILSDLVRI
jgi:hypothetical protein